MLHLGTQGLISNTGPYPKEGLLSSTTTTTVEAAVNIREVIETLEPSCE